MYPYLLFGIISLYDLFLTVGVLLAFFLGDKMGIMRGFTVALQKILIWAALVGILFGLFGAVFFQAVYNWIETGAFAITKNTGMTFYGGLIFGVASFLAVWFLAGRKKCKDGEEKKQFGTIADIAACLIPMAHGFGRLGCLTAGCCHGAETDAWYGINMWSGSEWVRYVPIQLFEAIFLFALSGVLFWLFFKKFGKESKNRVPLLPVYAIVYGVWRFFIEYARADHRGKTVLSFLTPSQLVAVIMIVAGIAYFCVWYMQKRKKEGKNDER